MKPEEIRKLLGGYATGTLTDDERNLLFSAALEDQELFDALADEEALRELLAEPRTRRALIQELEQAPVASSPRPTMWRHFTPSRWAIAGGLAALLLIAVGIQYKSSQPPPAEETVNLALNRAPENIPVPQPAAAPAAIPRTNSPKKAERQLADERRADAGRAEEPEKKAEAEADSKTAAREQLNQAVRDRIAQVSKESAPVAQAQPAPVTPAQIVTGGFRSAAAPPPPPPPLVTAGAAARAELSREINAKVTDVNGTIVSINAGSNVGLKAGDTVEIVRDSRVIATSKLSQVGATFAVGPLQRAQGMTDTPQAGDIVRRAAASQP